MQRLRLNAELIQMPAHFIIGFMIPQTKGVYFQWLRLRILIMILQMIFRFRRPVSKKEGLCFQKRLNIQIPFVDQLNSYPLK